MKDNYSRICAKPIIDMLLVVVDSAMSSFILRLWGKLVRYNESGSLFWS